MDPMGGFGTASPQPTKRKREADCVEETLAAKERRLNEEREQQQRSALAQTVKQSLTLEEKRRLIEEWKAEQEAKKQLAEESYFDVCATGHIERLFVGGPFALLLKLQERLDTYLDELEVLPSTDVEEERWVWSMIPGKGSVTLHHPSGKLVCNGPWVQEVWLQHWMKRWTEHWDDDTPKETHQPLSEEAEAYEQFEELPGMRRLFGGSPLEFQDHMDHAKGDTRSTLQELPAKAPGTKYWLWRHPKLKGAAQLITPSGEVKLQGNLKQQASFFLLMKPFTCPWAPGAPLPPAPPPPPPPTAAAFPPAPPSPPPAPAVGSKVRVRNLKNATQYNGCVGVVVQVLIENEGVKLDIKLSGSEHTLRLKQANTEALPAELDVPGSPTSSAGPASPTAAVGPGSEVSDGFADAGAQDEDVGASVPQPDAAPVPQAPPTTPAATSPEATGNGAGPAPADGTQADPAPPGNGPSPAVAGDEAEAEATETVPRSSDRTGNAVVVVAPPAAAAEDRTATVRESEGPRPSAETATPTPASLPAPAVSKDRDVNSCTAPGEAAISPDPPATSAAPPTGGIAGAVGMDVDGADPHPTVGSKIRIRNLKNSAQYNGRVATVVQVLEEDDGIKLDIKLSGSEQPLRLRLANAEALPADVVSPASAAPPVSPTAAAVVPEASNPSSGDAAAVVPSPDPRAGETPVVAAAADAAAGPAADTSAGAMGMDVDQAAAHPSVGSKVRIRNLKNATQYNGRVATVVQVLAEDDGVKLDIQLPGTEQTLRLKLANTEVVPAELDVPGSPTSADTPANPTAAVDVSEAPLSPPVAAPDASAAATPAVTAEPPSPGAKVGPMPSATDGMSQSEATGVRPLPDDGDAEVRDTPVAVAESPVVPPNAESSIPLEAVPVEEESKGAVATTAVWSAMDIDVAERQDVAQAPTVSTDSVVTAPDDAAGNVPTLTPDPTSSGAIPAEAGPTPAGTEAVGPETAPAGGVGGAAGDGPDLVADVSPAPEELASPPPYSLATDDDDDAVLAEGVSAVPEGP
eukprot:EG_transcript_1315